MVVVVGYMLVKVGNAINRRRSQVVGKESSKTGIRFWLCQLSSCLLD